MPETTVTPLWAKALSQPIEHQGRVDHLQQRRGIVRVGQCQDFALGWIFAQPGERGVELRGEALRLGQQRLGTRPVHHLGEGGDALPEDGFGQAEGREQLARGLGPEAGVQREAQPGCQFLALHGALSAGW
jgi:hypothetical protein